MFEALLLGGMSMILTNTWLRLTDLPVGRSQHAADIIGDKMYVHGGLINSTTLTAELFQYDLVTQDFAYLPSDLVARSGHTLSAIGGKLYAFGGHLTYAGSIGLKELWCYDLSTNQWTRLADNLYGRYNHTTNVIDGKLWVYGGDSNTGQTGIEQICCYDPATDTWTYSLTKPTINRYRHQHTVVVIDKKLYVHGGFGSSPLKDTWRYDTVNDTWAELPLVLKGRYAHSAVVIEGKMYIAGGDSQAANETYRYDPVGNVWTVLAIYPTHMWAEAVVHDGKMYVYGGSPPVPSAAMWRYTP